MMTDPPKFERHFRGGDSIRDIIIGLSDGLTVPFAIAAGLSGVIGGIGNSTSIVVAGTIAEIAAGSISMGLGGYLAARSDADHYKAERAREEREIVEMPEMEVEEVASIFRGYGLPEAQARQIAESFRERPKQWVDFMMKHELDLNSPDPKRIVVSPLTIGGAYAAGGAIPLLPYLLVKSVGVALPYSLLATLVALFVFGWVKGRATGSKAWASAVQTVIVGGLAAGAAFALARLAATGSL